MTASIFACPALPSRLGRRTDRMIGMVLVTHGRLALEFRAALEHVVGPQSQIETITIGPDDDMDQRRRDIVDAVKRVDSGDGVVVLPPDPRPNNWPETFASEPCPSSTSEVRTNAKSLRPAASPRFTLHHTPTFRSFSTTRCVSGYRAAACRRISPARALKPTSSSARRPPKEMPMPAAASSTWPRPGIAFIRAS
jgi:hypothetical protein